MFVPAHYRTPNVAPIELVIDEFPLALLLSQGAREPEATHVPVIRSGTPRRGGPAGGWSGMLLHGHMNRANPHWQSLTSGQRVKLAFTGPGSYITPRVYNATPAAPTWNFLSVHASGTVRRVLEHTETLAIIERTVATFEERFGAGWDWLPSREYFRSISPAVGAFEVVVDDIATMIKLSQDQPEPTRRLVADYLSDHSRGTARDLGRWMNEWLDPTDPAAKGE